MSRFESHPFISPVSGFQHPCIAISLKVLESFIDVYTILYAGTTMSHSYVNYLPFPLKVLVSQLTGSHQKQKIRMRAHLHPTIMSLLTLLIPISVLMMTKLLHRMKMLSIQTFKNKLVSYLLYSPFLSLMYKTCT